MKNSASSIIQRMYKLHGSQYEQPNWVVNAGDRILDIIDGTAQFLAKDWPLQFCSDSEAKVVLQAFAQDRCWGWNLSLQLARLLATRGSLVSEIYEGKFNGPEWYQIDGPSLFASYFAASKNGVQRSLQMLTTIPPHEIDGLFLALWTMDNPKTDENLSQWFRTVANQQRLSSGSACWWLGVFLKKWIARYNTKWLEPLFQAYFCNLN